MFHEFSSEDEASVTDGAPTGTDATGSEPTARAGADNSIAAEGHVAALFPLPEENMANMRRLVPVSCSAGVWVAEHSNTRRDAM